jgi:uncharacterized membrane protein YdjX (TVP38/TMEM64 family)
MVGVWLLILAGYWGYTVWNDLSPLATAQRLADFLQDNSYGPVIFVAVYLIRPLLLFPTAIFTLLAGYLFGSVWGVVYVTIGHMIAAAVAYVVGRYFGEDLLDLDKDEGRVEQYANYIRDNSFEAVLFLRLMLMNYDFVSYLSGFLRIDWKIYLLATFLGSLPGAVSTVLAGASVEGDFAGELPGLDPWMLAASAVMFAVSFGIAWYLRKQKKQATDDSS